MGKILLLSVGINNYPHLNSQLNYCVADAELIYDNYSQFNCQLKQLLLDENATRDEILKSIQDIKEIIRDEDYFIFSFAGHGFTICDDQEKINSKNSFICPQNFNPKYWDITAISLYDLNEQINSLEANSKLVIFDACHSGGALRKISEEFNLRDIEITDLIEILGTNAGTCIFTACDSHETAGENEEIGHGIFTHSLIESLEELGIDKKHALFEEVHDLVSTKVKIATSNEQNPKVKCNEEDFKVLTLPESKDSSRDEIQIDTTIVPTSSLNKSYEYVNPEKMTQLEQTAIQLIHEDRFIEFDKLFKSTINSIYKKLANPDIQYSAKIEDAIPYYESCREYLKPLILLSNYDIDYYNSKCLMNNLDYILGFEKLCHGKSGKTAIIEIPLVLIAEFLFQIMTKAYSKKDTNVLRKITSYQIDLYGITAPIIYQISFWSSDMFQRNIDTFLKYLYDAEWIKNDMFNEKFIEEMNEICFLFDCYSSNQENYSFYPTYIAFNDFNAPDRVTSKLESSELNKFIEILFSVKIEEFVPIIIQRLNYIATNYTGIRYFHLGGSFKALILRLEQLNQ